MYRKKKKVKAKEGKLILRQDISIKDYADADAPKCGKINLTVDAARGAHLKECELSRNAEASLSSGDEDVDIPLNWYDCLRDEKNKHLKSSLYSNFILDSEKNDVGFILPLTVWECISQFITPEDVKSFASICKDTHYITNTAKFWFSLYKRYYRDVDGMPEDLKPKHMVRRYGLKALVVRSLFYTYRPFVLRQLKEPKSETLLGWRCVYFFSSKKKDYWVHTIKFAENKISTLRDRRDNIDSKPNLLELLENIDANVDKHYKALQICTSDSCYIPMIIGKVLASIKLTLSRNLRFYNAVLTFNDGLSSYHTFSFTMDSVINTKVLSWWHPSFPRGDSFNPNLFSNKIIQDLTTVLWG